MSAIRAAVDLPLDPSTAFDAVVEELGTALRLLGYQFEPGPEGTVRHRDRVIARVVSWAPGRQATLEWRTAEWNDGVTEIDLRCEGIGHGSRVTLEHRGLDGLLGAPADLAGWFASQVAAPLARAVTPAVFGDWLTDRLARRPSGASSRAVYRDPLYHYPNFHVILAELALTADDCLLEVGCGGGALLKRALERGCRAAAVDHSPDMVALARAENAAAVASGRLTVVDASADDLPFPSETFTCAAMTGVLGFLPDPVTALAEIRRVLAPGGRAVILGSDPELRGTPGAPEPMASRLRFYDDGDLAALGRDAGFSDVQVVRRDLEPFAREAGVPEEHLPLFAGGARFLLARRR